jgi:hypothetical protein
MKTKDCFTELAIKIATVDMKLDAILKLLNKPEIEYEVRPTVIGADGVVDYNFYSRQFVNNGLPTQWPNESHTDYLKRIGQYNEASSDNENFEDSFK